MYLNVLKHPRLALGTIAAVGLVVVLTPEEEVLYTSVEKCISSGVYPKACQAASEDASRHHLATAPRFRNMVACEMDYGAGNCAKQKQSFDPNNSTGMNAFAPSPAGFVMPRYIENFADYSDYRRRQQNSKAGSPGAMSAYRQRNGDLVTPGSGQQNGSFSSGGGAGGLLASDMKQLNAKTNVRGRGGFGGGSSSGG